MTTKQSCACAEGQTKRLNYIDKYSGSHDGKIYDKVPTPTGLHVHDCEYVMQRNLVLDDAENSADRGVGGRHKAGWHQVYFAAVDLLSGTKL
jgi:hypothetical protein